MKLKTINWILIIGLILFELSTVFRAINLGSLTASRIIIKIVLVGLAIKFFYQNHNAAYYLCLYVGISTVLMKIYALQFMIQAPPMWILLYALDFIVVIGYTGLSYYGLKLNKRLHHAGP
tara:strand:- start:6564 stop:6923 length:360 start_codon:yes stop_codon:yes gene_type:complete